MFYCLIFGGALLKNRIALTALLLLPMKQNLVAKSENVGCVKKKHA